MRIQHNISALNASNKLKSNDNAISKNIAKLSSGYRINSAADDAAGLAVSEKMRAQINGLTQAQSNAENGISLVQTAEGGLNETQSILQRMNTLAVESANGTYQDGTDRANLQKEITALKSEVDRISTSTNFNQINLLDGTLGSTGTAAAATVQLSNAVKGAAYGFTDSVAGVYASAVATATIASAAKGDTETLSIRYTDGTNEFTKTITLTATDSGHVADADGKIYDNGAADDAAKAYASILNADSSFSKAFSVKAESDGKLTFTAKDKGTAGAKLTSLSDAVVAGHTETVTSGQKVSVTTAPSDAYESTKIGSLKAYDGTNLSDAVFTVNGQSFVLTSTKTNVSSLDKSIHVVTVTDADISGGVVSSNGATHGQDLAKAINDATGLATSADASGNIQYKTAPNAVSTNGVSFQIGSDNKADQRVSLSLGNMSSKGLGIQNVSVATQADAQKAIDTLKTALNTVSATRADLGALQNRLEHTTNNLSTMSENLTSAEASIRDVDMSSEYVQYSKNQILSQAANAMLAQANSQPQSVLSLLKG